MSEKEPKSGGQVKTYVNGQEKILSMNSEEETFLTIVYYCNTMVKHCTNVVNYFFMMNVISGFYMEKKDYFTSSLNLCNIY